MSLEKRGEEDAVVHRGSAPLGGRTEARRQLWRGSGFCRDPHCAEGEEEKGRGSKTVTRLEAGAVWDGRWSYNSR